MNKVIRCLESRYGRTRLKKPEELVLDWIRLKDDDYKDDAQRTCLPVRALSYAPSPPKTPQADKWQIFHNFNDFVFCVSSSFQVMNEEAKGKNRKLNTTKQRTAVFDIDY